MDITTIPTSELEKDLQDSLEDIRTCENAMIVGIQTYSGGSVKDRLLTNKNIVDKITAELNKRRDTKCKTGT